MDWTEKQECVLCCRGGKLLVCNGDGCPISVHKDCMGCEAYVDDAGNFHCPYCVYRQLTAEACQLREKAMLAKKALSTFLEEQMRDGNHQEPIVGLANKDKQILSEDKVCSVDGNKLVCDDVQNQRINLEKHQNSKTPLPCEETHDTFVSEQTDEFSNRHGEVPGINNVNSCRVMVVYKPNSNLIDACDLDCISRKQDRMRADQFKSGVSKRIKVDNRTRNAKRKFDGVVDNQQHTTSIEEAAEPKDACISSSTKKEIAHQKRKPFAAFNKNGDSRKEECMIEQAAETLLSLPNDRSRSRHGPTHLLDHPNGATKGSLEAKTGVMSHTESINVSNRGVLKDSSKQQLVIDRSMRHRAQWSEEEEEMLKEGVQKFSLLTRKNLPWKKILEFGRHVFDASRNPSDLKDKWRNMAK
ncbi:uncharacterized protein LOC112505679 isoform X2 [Cynara cardunculus var. scolymus]|uniref:uncharacterized protein LOC112505679 isoform X2 n=1 Tax=Cynara cardunculus var. scolymus TaxID=59895 RepID=UPI000D631177|nr:uncharacterized protein LOC112505679 isoform X2 [Cynara cardunculus var. scolymus]